MRHPSGETQASFRPATSDRAPPLGRPTLSVMDGARALVAAATAVSLGASVAGCGSGETEPTERGQNEPVGSTSEASPFRVGQEPTGYRLVQAGRGTLLQAWGDDTAGTDMPVTVLAPVGEGPGGPEEARVSLTGFVGYQSGLSQASSGDSEDQEEFELDGQSAIYVPAHENEGKAKPADLVADVGDDLAVKVSADDATRDELVDIARAVEPQDDHLLAPLVPDPPGDLEVVGSADADVAISLLTRPEPASERRPSGERAHSAVWAHGEETDAWSSYETVVVTTLPGTALDLDALAASVSPYWAESEMTVTPSEVAGRPAAVLDLAAQEIADNVLQAVITSTEEGDLLLVVAHGPQPPEVDQLTEIAASVEAADAQQWDDLVLASRGGPGLHPDPGAVELERGTVGDTDWLFQARVDVDGDMPSGSSSDTEDTTGQFLADPCLKLSTGGRVCTREGSGFAGGPLLIEVYDPPDDEEEPVPPGFLIIATTGTATTVRLHVDDTDALDTPLHLLPDERRSAGIFMGVDAEDLHPLDCIEPGEPVEPETIELLDDNGRRLPCSP